jgi:hypothetical protein
VSYLNIVMTVDVRSYIPIGVVVAGMDIHNRQHGAKEQFLQSSCKRRLLPDEEDDDQKPEDLTLPGSGFWGQVSGIGSSRDGHRAVAV